MLRIPQYIYVDISNRQLEMNLRNWQALVEMSIWEASHWFTGGRWSHDELIEKENETDGTHGNTKLRRQVEEEEPAYVINIKEY